MGGPLVGKSRALALVCAGCNGVVGKGQGSPPGSKIPGGGRIGNSAPQRFIKRKSFRAGADLQMILQDVTAMMVGCQCLCGAATGLVADHHALIEGLDAGVDLQALAVQADGDIPVFTVFPDVAGIQDIAQ